MLVQDELVMKLSHYLASGAYIYLSSDSNRVILWMIHKFLQNDFFRLIKADDINEIPDHVFLPVGSIISSSQNAGESLPRDFEAEDIKEEEGDIDDENDRENENKEIDKLNDYWIDYNPLGELSERELICEVDWRKVKRCVLIRC